jgi:hypothetical protein
MIEASGAFPADLYRAFAHVRRPARVSGCPHCVDDDEDGPLLDGPLRSLAPADLSRYAFKALSTWGDEDDFRYFTPRLIECAAADRLFTDPQIVFGKLAVAGWQDWPAGERTAVEGFLASWWAGTLDHHPATPDVGVVLSCLGRTGVDLDPYLDHWGRLESVAAIRHLRDFALWEVHWTGLPSLADTYWAQDGDGHRQVIAWLTGGRAADAVEAAFAAEDREDVLELLDEIHSVVRVG